MLRSLAIAVVLLAASSSAAYAQAPPPGPPAPQPASSQRPIRLILKDGSEQRVRTYQIIGDRVRYYSVDRSQWEEMPASLVDWEATRRAAQSSDERTARALELARQVDLAARPGSLDVDAGLPPGVEIPSEEGVYVWDGQHLQPVAQNLAESRLNKGRFLAQILSPVPVIPTRYTIQLKGAHATLRVHASEPSFYVRRAAVGEPSLRLIQARVHGSRREIEWLSNYLGAQRTEANEIPVRVVRLGPRLYHVEPEQDLARGEYVLAEVVPDRGLDLAVWDFGVDPQSAPRSKPH
jgi:hypothetical protein